MLPYLRRLFRTNAKLRQAASNRDVPSLKALASSLMCGGIAFAVLKAALNGMNAPRVRKLTSEHVCEEHAGLELWVRRPVFSVS